MAAGLVLGGCSSGNGDEGTAGGGRAGGGGDASAEQAIAMTITELHVESMAAAPGPFPEDVWAQVHGVLDAYLDRGLVRPLRSGEPPRDLEPLFSPAALQRATTVDYVAVLEDGTALAGPVTSPRANAALTLLTDRDGRPVVVNARLDLSLSVESDDLGTVVLDRTGEVVLVDDGQGWRIDSYDLRNRRDTAA